MDGTQILIFCSYFVLITFFDQTHQDQDRMLSIQHLWLRSSLCMREEAAERMQLWPDSQPRLLVFPVISIIICTSETTIITPEFTYVFSAATSAHFQKAMNGVFPTSLC